MTQLLASIVVALSITIGVQDPRPTPALTGRVLHAELPVPGATITLTKGDRTASTITDEGGAFSFATLEAGAWNLKVEMRGFGVVMREITVPPSSPELSITLTMTTLAEIVGAGAMRSAWPVATGADKADRSVSSEGVVATSATSTIEVPEILSGSVVNGAATRFAQPRAAGNNRPRGASLYTGALTGNFGNSAWNAAPYSFGGATVPPPDYADTHLAVTFGGPLRIPFVKWWGPQTRLNYQHVVNNNANTRSALVPTFEERLGDLSSVNAVIRDPRTGLPFAGNIIPSDRIVPQATALLAWYPLPTGTVSTGANFQRPVVGTSTTDRLQIDLSHSVNVRTQVAGQVTYQRAAADSVNVFGFVDENRQSSINATLALTRRMSTRLNIRFNYQFTSVDSTLTPFFSNRINVSGDAGIAGNAQDPLNWGPPTIGFPDFTELNDGSYQHSTRQSHTVGGEMQLRRGVHNLTFGADVRLHAINLFTQSDPRGTLSFTGAVTGNGFADFLLGVPSTSAIAFGNESAHLRGGSYDAYFKDDYRFAAGLTFDLGVRWEYESPYSERDGRLANLDVAPGFTDVSLVTGTDPVGPLTGNSYPSTLVHRDLLGFEPRLGVSWRPILASSLVIKGGYGLYRNLGVYQSIGTLLAQQPPFSNSYRVQNSLATPLTLANPFPASQPSRTTFAVDPDYRTALLHSWQVTVQRDFPASLTMIAAYFGDHGTRLTQSFLPNSYAPGAINPCSACPTGFTYLAADGRSTRNAFQLIVRRRLYAGFTSTVTYTLAKAADNASTFSNTTMSPGSLSVAQNWLDLGAERGPSSFDQRHLVVLDVQYTTGVGMIGGTLVDSFWGKLYKDWTLTAQLNTGSGLPVTPTYFVAIPGTGTVGVRPSLTGQPIESSDPDAYANSGAFAPPPRGSWGDAGRNSIRGPSTFSFDVAVARTFRFNRRFNLDWRITATNVLNRVTFTTIERSISSPQFGHPTHANQMRRILTSFIFRF